MSVNWVMLAPSGDFVRLPDERILFSSPPRTSFSLRSPTSYPGREPFSASSNSGVAFVTNLRIIYIPGSQTPQLTSFSAPILKVHDSHITSPFFGPNGWTAAVQPVSGGNLPTTHSHFELKLTFKDGGAFDFHSNFEKMKELQSNAAANGQRDFAAPVEQLPAYEESYSAPPVQPENVIPASSGLEGSSPSGSVAARSGDGANLTSASGAEATLAETPAADEQEPARIARPTEPPPGYEEVQRDSVASEIERRLRSAS